MANRRSILLYQLTIYGHGCILYTDKFQQHAVGAADVADHLDRRGLFSTQISRFGCVQEVL